jgi:Kef-type K+ transport system membrane component KefB
MKLSRRTSNILLVIGVYMLLTWGFRVFTWLEEFRVGTLVAPGVHFSLVVIGLAIGVYLVYLGVKGRRATKRAA